jgi:hypothetical protein
VRPMRLPPRCCDRSCSLLTKTLATGRNGSAAHGKEGVDGPCPSERCTSGPPRISRRRALTSAVVRCSVHESTQGERRITVPRTVPPPRCWSYDGSNKGFLAISYRSSKPARRRNPALGGFGSHAAPLQVTTCSARGMGDRVGRRNRVLRLRFCAAQPVVRRAPPRRTAGATRPGQAFD